MEACTTDWKNKIDEFESGSMTATDRLLLEDHLKRCRDCAEYFQNRQMQILLKRLPTVAPGNDFEHRLSQRIEKINEEKHNPFFRFLEVYVIIVLLILGLITYFGFEMLSNFQAEPTKKQQETNQPVNNQQRDVVQ